MDWNFIDKVVYINLERSTERNEHMKEFVKPFGDKVIRFNAIDMPTRGHLGCTCSHIAVLEMAIQNKWKNVLILEDDIEWNHSKIGYDNLQTILTKNWDVILFGGCYVNVDLNTYKISQSCSTASYLVKSEYFETLLKNYNEGKVFLERKYTNRFFIDSHWWRLMKKDNWYIIFPNLMYQMNSFSVIENKIIERAQQFVTNRNIIECPIENAFWHDLNVTDTLNSLEPNKFYKLEYTMFISDPAVGKTKLLTITTFKKDIITIEEGSYFRLSISTKN